ncbi:hypothetical protein V2G26_002208 [Clonostachys chloroleuca]
METPLHSSSDNLAPPGTTKMRPEHSLYPDVADISHATPALVEFLRYYFQAKSSHDADTWIKDFDISKIFYIDTVLGLHLSQENFEIMARSVMASAVMFFEDTPTMFGTELRGISALDMENGKVIRQVDYWDGRRAALASGRLPLDQYPSDFKESIVKRAPDPVIRDIVNRLHAALSTGDSSAVAQLLDVDAIWEDRTTRTILDGRLAIERYLSRASSTLPYGAGMTIRHVVGSVQGGDYEWICGPGAAARHGITALKLNEDRLITLISPLWDASYAGDDTMAALIRLTLEP